MPGIAASTSETCSLGPPPNSVEAPENSLAFAVTWAWTSMPMTTSQSPVAPLISFDFFAGASMAPRRSIRARVSPSGCRRQPQRPPIKSQYLQPALTAPRRAKRLDTGQRRNPVAATADLLGATDRARRTAIGAHRAGRQYPVMDDAGVYWPPRIPVLRGSAGDSNKQR